MVALHLAQFNIGRLRFDQDDPGAAEFMNALDEVNAAGEMSPGFVWRHQDDSGAAVDTNLYGDPRLIINYTIWESVDQLRQFAYHGAHLDYFRRRLEWFEAHDEASHVMWWIPAGEIPSTAEAMRRLEHLQTNGPTSAAFGFRDAPLFDPESISAASLGGSSESERTQ